MNYCNFLLQFNVNSSPYRVDVYSCCGHFYKISNSRNCYLPIMSTCNIVKISVSSLNNNSNQKITINNFILNNCQESINLSFINEDNNLVMSRFYLIDKNYNLPLNGTLSFTKINS